MGEPVKLVGYADRLSVRAGADVTFYVSSEHEQVQAEIVRLRRGGGPRHGITLLEDPVDTEVPATFAGRVQTTTSGSFIEAQLGSALSDIGVALWFKPTAATDESRPLISVGSCTVTVSRRGVAVAAEQHAIAHLDADIVDGQWYFVSARIDRQGRATLSLAPPEGQPRVARAVTTPVSVTGTLRIGAATTVRPGLGDTFNGVVARPVVSSAWDDDVDAHLARGGDPLDELDPDSVSALDFSASISTGAMADRGGLTGGAVVHQLPARAVPGPFWSGRERDFRLAPAEFDGIHLHDDDLVDANWSPALTWSVPPTLPSGVYALKLTAGDEVDRIPVVVTPAVHRSPVLVVLPTWTYLAYANWRTYAEYEPERLVIYGEERGVDSRDHWLARHPEFGRSLYDVHSDGSGCFYAGSRRPIVNIRPDYYTPTTRGFRHFAQDLLLLHWLEARGEDYAVVTDDEVDREGAELLSQYTVVLTGSHPEYSSGAMLDAYAAFTDAAGRLMYLGGNGFYQVTARHPACPDAIEIRRGHAGVATWVSAPGEEHLSATGEPGGLWRMRGRAPNRLVGLGFTAQGFDKGHGYQRSARSADPDVAWVFDGVSGSVGDVFGDAGPGLVGAAADEFDRSDTGLGTPAHAAVLASSVGHSERIGLAPEEIDHGYAAPPPGIHPNIRADIVLFGKSAGGAVFSVGSIGWTTAMAHHDGDNSVSRITANVLDRFRDHHRPLAPQP